MGATPSSTGTTFRVFADPAAHCAVRLFGPAFELEREAPLAQTRPGYFSVELAGVRPGSLYKFVVDGRELPDPYARFLPQGVHGPAMVIGARRSGRPEPVLRPLREQTIYELHVGTFTKQGTYEAARGRLADIAALGITTLELMPLSSFAGERGWGYDGVAHYAPHAAYGTTEQLCDFIDHAHELGLAVLLDVVYNHFGPAGNYLSAYSTDYFTHEIQNAWGDAPNFALPAMRSYVIDNALYWLLEIGFDGLRLDATHAIIDPSDVHILRELAGRVRQEAPGRVLIAEDERNDPSLVTQIGLDGVWADDFHHGVRVSLTGERDGYYAAYEPGAVRLAETINHGWLFRGQPYPPHGRPRGKPADSLAREVLIYCIQNHDQIGNRALGDRLHAMVSLDAYCAASSLLLFLPMTPLLFMGQEWASTSPFMFFTDHDAELGRAISLGRREEFKHFSAFAQPGAPDAVPDPQDVTTFLRSKLRWEERTQPARGRVLALYRSLLELRRSHPVLNDPGAGMEASAHGPVLVVERESPTHGRLRLFFKLGDSQVSWEKLEVRPGTPVAFASDGQTQLGHELAGATAVITSG